MSAPVDGTPHIMYRLYSAEDELLYIGITMNFPARINQHKNDKFWWEEVSTIRLERHRSRNALRAAEREAILAERPTYNLAHNAPARIGQCVLCRESIYAPALNKYCRECRDYADDLDRAVAEADR